MGKNSLKKEKSSNNPGLSSNFGPIFKEGGDNYITIRKLLLA